MKNKILKHTMAINVCVCALLLFLALVPLLVIAPYNVPAIDDYTHGTATHDVYVETGSLLSVIKGAVEWSVQKWWDWGGIYFSHFLSAFTPIIFGAEYYSTVPYIMLSALILGFGTLSFVVFRKLFRFKKASVSILTCLMLLICVLYMPGPNEGIYYFATAINYTFIHALGLFVYALILVYLAFPQTKFLPIVILLFLFLLGGGNLATCVFLCVLLGFTEMILIIEKHPRRWILLIFFLFYLAFFLLNVFAPGNGVRQARVDQNLVRPGAYQTLLRSFRELKTYLGKWLTLPLISFWFLLLPVLRSEVRSPYNCLIFQKPWLLSVISFCLLASMFAPIIYALDDVYILRVQNLIYISFCFLLFFNTYVWMCWFVEYSSYECTFLRHELSVRYLLICLLCCVLSSLFTYDGHISSVDAARSYLNGDVGLYHHQYMKRLKLLENPNEDPVGLTLFSVYPRPLFFADTLPRNTISYIMYYHKNVYIEN